MSSQSRTLFFILFVCAVFVLIFCDDDDYIVALTESGFDAIISTTSHFVMFYAPWCGYCKKLIPVWNTLSKSYNVDNPESGVTIAKVDCTVYTGLCLRFEVTGYPTLKYFHSGDVEISVRFRGERTLDKLNAFVEEQLTKKPSPPDPGNLDRVIALTQKFNEEIKTGFWFVKFYVDWCPHCKELSPIWNRLSNKIYHKNIQIAKIDCSVYDPICREHKITAYPTILVFKNGQQVGEKYSGGRDVPSFLQYIKEVTQLPLQQTPEDLDVGEDFVPRTSDDVIKLDESNFEGSIVKGVVFVKFYAPWCSHCQKLAPTWIQLASKFEYRSDVTIAKVDCEDNKSLCKEHDIDSYPTLVLYKDGVRVADYQESRHLDNLISFVKEHAGELESHLDFEENGNVKELTLETFDSYKKGIWLVKFYVPWCQHCRRLKPIWNRISHEVSEVDNLYMAQVNCDTQPDLCHLQSIDRYPTIHAYIDGYKFDVYGGPLTYEDLHKYVEGTHLTLTYAKEREEAAKREEEAKDSLYVRTLTDSSFAPGTFKGLWFVEFYVPECKDCEKFSPIWSKIAKSLIKEPLSLGKVNCETSADVCLKHKVQSYPTLVSFKDGKQLQVYSGPFSEEHVLKHITNVQKSNILTEINEKKIELMHIDGSQFKQAISKERTFILFHSSSCEKCGQAIEYWVSISDNLKTSDLFHLMKCDHFTEICSKYKIDQFPEIVVFQYGAEVKRFSGDLNYKTLYNFVFSEISKRDEL